MSDNTPTYPAHPEDGEPTALPIYPGDEFPAVDWFKFPDADAPEYRAAVDELTRMTAANDAILMELMQHTQGLDTLISRLRLRLFLDFHLGTIDGRRPVAARWPRLAYEMHVQQVAKVELVKIREQVNARLREAAIKSGQPNQVQRASGLIIPNGRG